MESILTAEIYMICLIISCLLYYWNKKSSFDSVSEIWMSHILLSLCLNNAFNFLFLLLHEVYDLGALDIPVAYITKTLYILTLCLLVSSWCTYSEMILQGKDWRFQEKHNLFVLFSVGASWIVPVVNLFHHWMFTINSDNGYKQHMLFYLEMVYLILISGSNGVRMISRIRKETNPDRKEYYVIVAIFPILLLLPAVTALFGVSYPISCVSITIEMLGLYVVNTRQQISVDPLTQVNNRNNLLSYLDSKLENHNENLYLLMLDLDYFKQINDKYGHIEGDCALTEVARIIKQSCRSCYPRPYIARYGGDEFIIIVEGSKENADTICSSIQSALETANQTNELYDLSVSIGCIKWQWPMRSTDLISAADKEMYRIKAARKQKDHRVKGRIIDL